MKNFILSLVFLISFSTCCFSQCEAYFTAVAGENGFVSFNNSSVPVDQENTQFLWEFGDGSISDGTMPVHTYEVAGTYEVCLYIGVFDGEILVCSDSYCVSLEVLFENETNCPDEIASGAGEDCGVMNFEIGSFVLGEAVTWYPGDETGAVEGGHFFSHTYAEPGEYNVYAFYTSPACPDGVELFTIIVVEECGGACPENIVADQIDCDSYIFHINGVDTGNVIWQFGDGGGEISSITADHTYAENGTYIVVALYSGPNCPNQTTVVFTVIVNCEEEDNCPTEIWSGAGEDCGVMNFEIGSFVEGEEVTWYPGDETGAVEGGHFFSHTYAEPGEYNVCAFYTSPACPNGVELCTTIVVESCNDCPSVIEYNYNCPDGLISFYVANWPESSPINWVYNGVSISTNVNWITVEIDEGPGYICAFSGGMEEAGCSQICLEMNFNCGDDECPTEIWSGAGDNCAVMNFEAGSFVEGELVTWYFGDGTSQSGGHFVQHQYNSAGTYTITAYVTNNNCEGVQLTTVVEVEPCEDPCEWNFTLQQLACMYYHLYNAPEASEDYTYQVSWGDGTPIYFAGAFDTHVYQEDGTYELCVTRTAPNCEPYTVCETIIVDCIQPECNLELEAEQTEDFSFTFTAFGTPEALPMHWNFGDGSPVLEATWVTDHVYQEAGEYTVCIWYETEECGVQEACITVYAGDQVCPNEIIISEEINCHQFSFSVNNWSGSEYGDILWNFGDNEGYGMNPFLHMYMNPGVYEVCAEGTTESCPGGFEICTELVVEACGQNGEGCPSYIWGWPMNDCGLWHFEAGAESDMANIIWDFGDGTITDDLNTIANHQYEVDGVYIVTVTIANYGEGCASSIVLLFTLEANACEENPCDVDMWSSTGEECGLMLFEAGSFVEGEEFIWYFGDGTSAEGGHYITHQYNEPGTYIVNCVFSNNDCPGWQEVITIIVEECENTCTEFTIGLDSYVGEGGPNTAYWWIEDADGETIDQGVAQYSANDPYYDEAMCFEDGCYTLIVEGMGVTAPFFDIFIQSAGESIIQEVNVINDNLVELIFGINSDCSNVSEDCEAMFEPIYTNTAGHIEFQNTSAYDGTATWSWSYGNETGSDGFGGNVWYEENGTYIVCLTITNGECTDTHCETIVVSSLPGGCESNVVTISIMGENLDDLYDIVNFNLQLNDISIEDWVLTIPDGFAYTGEFCLPDGCYELELSTDGPSLLDMITVVASMNGVDLSTLEYLQGSVLQNMSIGVNVDCEDNVNELSGSNWTLYPNPASEFIQFTSASKEKISRIEILDATGRMIVSNNFSNQPIDISSIASGCYFVRVVGENHIEVLPLNIQH